jgi:glycosyltransferase involved in cell wall biosynthesis
MPGRLANYLSYLALAVPRGVSYHAHVVLAMTDPPCAGIAGALIATVRRVPFVYNIRDLHPDVIVATGMAPATSWIAKWEALHRWALRRADRIIVLGDDMKARVAAKGVDLHRVVVVRDGAPVPHTRPSPTQPITREVRAGFPFVVMHAGNLGVYGAWETLIAAAKLLEDSPLGLIFVGDGARAEYVRSLAADVTRVRVTPFLPRAFLSDVLAAGDLHVVTVRRGFEGLVVPSKLYGVLAAGRPVLAVAPEQSDVARIVSRHGCGFVADPDDPRAVASAIRQAMAEPDRLAAMARRARLAAAVYEERRQLGRFVDVIHEVLGQWRVAQALQA